MKDYPGNGHEPLGPKEIRALACEGRKAWTVQQGHGLVEPGQSHDDWRHQQVARATGGRARGLRAATRADYRTILSWFLALQGSDIGSYLASMATGKAARPRSARHAAPGGDTVEERELAWRQYQQALAETGYRPEYAAAIIRARHGYDNPRSLDARQLAHITWTLRNRAAARDGRGDPARRNKSQRRATRAGAPQTDTTTEPQEHRWNPTPPRHPAPPPAASTATGW